MKGIDNRKFYNWYQVSKGKTTADRNSVLTDVENLTTDSYNKGKKWKFWSDSAYKIMPQAILS